MVMTREVDTDLRYQTQANRHDPANGIYGDCARTAIACMLEVPRDDVPHFYEFDGDPDFYKKMDAWLRDHGLARVSMAFNGDDGLNSVLSCIGHLNPGLRFLLVGASKTGVNHVVICQDGKIDHDPSITQSGIVGPCEPDGFYWMEFFTPTRFVDGKENRRADIGGD